MKEIYITHGLRTAIGKIGKSLSDKPDVELGGIVVSDLMNRAAINKREIQHVVMGQVRQHANPSNVARAISLRAGLPETVPAYTVHRQCGSGLQAIMNACQMIISDEADVVIAGGVENMSRSVYFMRNTKKGMGNGNYMIEDSLTQGGPGAVPRDLYGDLPMGITAEKLAEIYHISREEQDIFSHNSQEKAAAAISEGRFKQQIVPITLNNGKIFDTDEHPFLSDLEKLKKLRAVFKKDGSVTAGNSSGRNDGAAAVLVMSKEKADILGYQPMARLISMSSSGCDPTVMGLGPVECTRNALDYAGLKLQDIGVIELNEAFAAQSIAVLMEWEKWGISRDELKKRVNPNGGAIALGHPVGCTGAMLVVKCLHELMRAPEKKRGLVTLCCGGGLGVAMIIEKM